MKRELKVFSLWQPWATLCVAPDPTRGGVLPKKQWETRAWRPGKSYHATGAIEPIAVAIHAAKRASDLRALDNHDGYRMPYGALFRNAIKDVGFTTRTLPLGAIIGVAMITRIERTESIRDRLSDEELAFGNYGDGRYAFKLDEPLLLPNPVPFKGRQSVLWPLEGEPLEQVWIEIARSVVRTWVPGE